MIRHDDYPAGRSGISSCSSCQNSCPDAGVTKAGIACQPWWNAHFGIAKNVWTGLTRFFRVGPVPFSILFYHVHPVKTLVRMPA